MRRQALGWEQVPEPERGLEHVLRQVREQVREQVSEQGRPWELLEQEKGSRAILAILAL